MRLSLLRAPKAPDAHADMGRHRIRYAVLPHAGPLDARIIRAGYNFNHPLVVESALGGAAVTSSSSDIFKSISVTGGPSLVLDVVKRGEDDEDVSRDNLPRRKGKSIILRVYESLGGKSRGTIHSTFPVKKVWKCNVLEDDETALDISKGKDDGNVQVDIELRAFEVATYRLQL